MERYTTNTMTIKRKGMFDRSRKSGLRKGSKQKKSILGIGLKSSYKDKVVDIVDDKREYERLTARDGRQSEKIMKPAKEEGEKKSDEKSGSNQNSEPVAPVKATE